MTPEERQKVEQDKDRFLRGGLSNQEAQWWYDLLIREAEENDQRRASIVQARQNLYALRRDLGDLL